MHRRYSIAKKLPAATLCLCLILGLTSFLILSNQIGELSASLIDNKSRTALSRLDELVRTPLFNNDSISVQVALTGATEEANIFSASLVGVDNNLISQSTKSGPKPENTERFSRNIELQDTLIGTLVIELDSQPIYRQYNNLMISWLLLWLLFTAASTYGCHRYSEQLARRLDAGLGEGVDGRLVGKVALGQARQRQADGSGERGKPGAVAVGAQFATLLLPAEPRFLD